MENKQSKKKKQYLNSSFTANKHEENPRSVSIIIHQVEKDKPKSPKKSTIRLILFYLHQIKQRSVTIPASFTSSNSPAKPLPLLALKD